MPIEMLAKDLEVLALAKDHELKAKKDEDTIILSSENHSIAIKPIFLEDKVLYSRRQIDTAIWELTTGG